MLEDTKCNMIDINFKNNTKHSWSAAIAHICVVVQEVGNGIAKDA